LTSGGTITTTAIKFEGDNKENITRTTNETLKILGSDTVATTSSASDESITIALSDTTQKSIADTATQATKNATDISNLNKSLDDTNSNLTKLNESVTTASDDFASLKDEITKTQTDLSDRITALENSSSSGTSGSGSSGSGSSGSSGSGSTTTTKDEVARETATTALTTAENNTKSIDTIKSEINTINDNVATAQTTADDAISKAQSAQTTANNAKSAADKAQTTADSALNLAKNGKITFGADSGTPSKRGFGESINVLGDGKNISTSIDGDNITVTLADELNIKSVTASTITADTFKAGNTQISNSGLSVGKTSIKDGEISIGSTTITDNQIKVGSTAISDGRITNITTIQEGTDAVNRDYVDSAVSKISNGIQTVKSDIAQIKRDIKTLKKDTRAGIASASAMGMLNASAVPGKTRFSLSGAHHEGQVATAMGLSHMSANGKWTFNIAAAVDSQKQSTQGVSFSYDF